MKTYVLSVSLLLAASASAANELTQQQLDAFGILWPAMSERAKVDYPNHFAGEAGSSSTKCIVQNSTNSELNEIISGGPIGRTLTPSLAAIVDRALSRSSTQNCL